MQRLKSDGVEDDSLQSGLPVITDVGLSQTYSRKQSYWNVVLPL